MLMVGCADWPGDLSGTTWNNGFDSCDAFNAEPVEMCLAFGDVNVNGEGRANQKCCACGGGTGRHHIHILLQINPPTGKTIRQVHLQWVESSYIL